MHAVWMCMHMGMYIHKAYACDSMSLHATPCREMCGRASLLFPPKSPCFFFRKSCTWHMHSVMDMDMDMDMDMEHGTWNMDMEHGHGTWNMDMDIDAWT